MDKYTAHYITQVLSDAAASLIVAELLNVQPLSTEYSCYGTVYLWLARRDADHLTHKVEVVGGDRFVVAHPTTVAKYTLPGQWVDFGNDMILYL